MPPSADRIFDSSSAGSISNCLMRVQAGAMNGQSFQEDGWFHGGPKWAAGSPDSAREAGEGSGDRARRATSGDGLDHLGRREGGVGSEDVADPNAANGAENPVVR